MKKKSKSNPIWPYLGILGCLFLLSLAAPRAWERRAQRNNAPPQQKTAGVSPRIAHESAPPVEELEIADDTEFEPRASEMEFVQPFEFPQTPLVAPSILVPPASYFAEDFRLDDSPLDAAAVDQVPQDAVPIDIAMPAPVEPPTIELAALPRGLEPAAPLPQETLAPLVEEELPRQLAPQQPPPSEAPPVQEPDAELPTELDVAAEPEAAAEPENTLQATWPLPRKLLAQLSDLAHEDAQLVWVSRASQLINELCHASELGQQRATLAALRELATRDALQPGADPSLESQAARVRYGVMRWVDVWEAAADLEESPPRVLPAEDVASRVRPIVEAFGRLTADGAVGTAWRDYLDFASLQAAAASGASLKVRQDVARRTLERMNSRKLSDVQRKFISGGPLVDLQNELQAWLADEFEVNRLLANIEELEYTGLASDAAAVAADYQHLTALRGRAAQTMAAHLDTHYRNANLRVAVNVQLANRLVPQPGRIDSPVRDTVVNVPVRGHSSTFTKLSVLFVPDPERIRIGLEAHGRVAANTVSDAGPARFRNRGQSTFLVRKLMVFGPKGLLVWPAIAEAENNYNYLVAMETDYDNVPIVGSVVRNIARTQHDEVSTEARRQTEAKVATRALQQLDSEVQSRLTEAERNMQAGQGATLKRLGLELVPISLATTDQRAVGRLRLASDDQLGAFTPRPRAPSDSWFSLQVHQSALNNMLAVLDLEGKTFELLELFGWVAQKLGQPELARQEDLPEDVRITFADRDAARIQTVDGRLEVTFAIKELTHEGSRWRDFQVRAYYVPKTESLAALFVRDTDPHYQLRLDGQSMRGKIEFKLRAIFSKVLSKNRDLRLLPGSVTEDARLRELQMSQFTIEDGWIGLAYSPRRVSSRVARKPE